MVEGHGADMSSKDRKDARRIQTNFTFDGAGGGGQHFRREREPPPQQPQQQQAQSTSNTPGRPSTSRRRDAFGATLTGPGITLSHWHNQANRPNSPPTEPDADEFVFFMPIVTFTDRRFSKQTALLERLESLAPNPSAAVAAIKAAIRSYRSAESNARDLILTTWNVMDCHLEHTASIVNALVDTLDEEEKKQDVLASWKGFVVEVILRSKIPQTLLILLQQKSQFPEPTPTSVGSEYAGIASGRVLNAKHATSARSSQSVWSRVAMAASSSSSIPLHPQRFPPLGGTSSLATRPNGQRKTPWLNSSRSLTPRLPQASGISSASQPRNFKAPNLSGAQFPELNPSSPARVKLPVSGNVSLTNILGNSGARVTNVWGGNPTSGGGTTTATGSVPQIQSADEPTLGTNKRKGKQKQTLFTLGSFPT